MISNSSDCIKRIGYHDGEAIEKFAEFLLAGCEAVVIFDGDECFHYQSGMKEVIK